MKEWYIFRNDCHVGPYDQIQLVNLYREGKLLQQDLIWREGQSGWLPLSIVAQAHRQGDLFLLWESIEDHRLGGWQELVLETPKNQKENKENKENNEVKKLNDEPLKFPDIPPETSKENGRSVIFKVQKVLGEKLQIFKKYILTLVTLSVLALFSVSILMWILPHVSPSEKIQRVQQEWNSISNELKTYQKKWIADFSLNFSDHVLKLQIFPLHPQKSLAGGLVLLVNRPYWGEIELTLKSMPEKIINTQNILAYTRKPIYEGKLYFQSFEMLKGEEIQEGYYQYEVVFYRRDFWASIIKYSKEKSWPKIIQTFLLNSELWWEKRGLFVPEEIHTGEILLSSQSPEEFDQTLQEFWQAQKEKTLLPIRELYEKVQTLMMVIDKLFEEYDQILSEMIFSRDIDKLVYSYSEKWAPLLQAMTVNNQALYTENLSQKKVLASRYQQLILFTPKISQMVMEMVENIKKIAKPKSKEKMILKELSQETKEELIKELRTLKNILESELGIQRIGTQDQQDQQDLENTENLEKTSQKIEEDILDIL